MVIGEKSHSLTEILANKKRRVALSPVIDSCRHSSVGFLRSSALM